MNNAIWKGKKINIHDIVYEYIQEKEIRLASARGELQCPDPDCQNKRLKYCNGDKRGAYFAHCIKTECDYAEFDQCKNRKELRELSVKLYNHFCELKCDVEIETKIIPSHYTYLLFKSHDNPCLAIEFARNQINAEDVNKLNEMYRNANIAVKWIVVDSINIINAEYKTHFIERYSLNEKQNKDLLIIDNNTNNVIQYKYTKKIVLFNGNLCSSIIPENQFFHKKGTISDLVYENQNITLNGFYQDYKNWETQQIEKYRNKELEDKKRIQVFRENVIKESEQSNLIAGESKETSKIPTLAEQTTTRFSYNNKALQTNTTSDYEAMKNEILPFIDQQQEPVIDSNGIQWIKCEHCNEVLPTSEFSVYGGENKRNIGICKKCLRNNTLIATN